MVESCRTISLQPLAFHAFTPPTQCISEWPSPRFHGGSRSSRGQITPGMSNGIDHVSSRWVANLDLAQGSMIEIHDCTAGQCALPSPPGGHRTSAWFGCVHLLRCLLLLKDSTSEQVTGKHLSASVFIIPSRSQTPKIHNNISTTEQQEFMEKREGISWSRS